MKPTPGRQALNHFAAAAGIGLTLTALSALLPDLIARQQMLSPQTAGYAVLSLLISGGMAAYGYMNAHQAQLVETVTGILSGDLAPASIPVEAAGAAVASSAPAPAQVPSASASTEQRS